MNYIIRFDASSGAIPGLLHHHTLTVVSVQNLAQSSHGPGFFKSWASASIWFRLFTSHATTCASNKQGYSSLHWNANSLAVQHPVHTPSAGASSASRNSKGLKLIKSFLPARLFVTHCILIHFLGTLLVGKPPIASENTWLRITHLQVGTHLDKNQGPNS